jgi:hypothetical protein
MAKKPFLLDVGLAAGNSTVNLFANSSIFKLNDTLSLTATTFLLGNSTVNVFANTSAIIAGQMAINQTGFLVGNSTVNVFSNSSTLLLGGYAGLNQTTLFAGNSTVNAVVNSSTLAFGPEAVFGSSIRLGNSTVITVINTNAITLGANIALGTERLFLGNSTVNAVINASGVTVGANVILGLARLFVGNSTVNAVANSLGYYRNGTLQGVGKQTIWVPGGGLTPRTSNGSTSVSTESTTNKVMLSGQSFGAVTNTYAVFSVRMPKSWNLGTLTWEMKAAGLNNGTSIDAAYGSAVLSTDTGGVNNAIYIGPESTALTIGSSPSEKDLAVFQIARLPADAGDTLAVSAILVGLHLYYTTDDTSDA